MKVTGRWGQDVALESLKGRVVSVSHACSVPAGRNVREDERQFLWGLRHRC